MKAAAIFLLLLVIVLGMTAWDQYVEAKAAREELEHRKAVACPAELRGRDLVMTAYSERDFFRPRTASLNCFYARAK